MYGTDQDSGRAQGNRAQVAAKAIVPARETRLLHPRRVQRVEDNALLGIERAQLQLLPVLHKADGHVVVKIDRARSSRGDVGNLDAGLRKHQDLRVGVYTQLFEQRGKISPSIWRVVELGPAALQLFVQTGYGIVAGPL